MKIALCIIGGYKKDDYETIKSTFLDENEGQHQIDTYISTWDVTTSYEYVHTDNFNLETDILTFWDLGLSADSHRRINFNEKTKDLTMYSNNICISDCRENMKRIHEEALKSNRRWSQRIAPWHYRSIKNYLTLHKKMYHMIRDKNYDIIIICRPDGSTIPKDTKIKFIDQRTFLYNGKLHNIKNNIMDNPYVKFIYDGVKSMYKVPDDTKEFVCCSTRDYGYLEAGWMFGTQKAIENTLTLVDFWDHAIDLMYRFNIVVDLETAYIIKYITSNIPVYIINPEDIDNNEMSKYFQKMNFMLQNYLNHIKDSARVYINV